MNLSGSAAIKKRRHIMLKKILSLILVAVMLVLCCACNTTDNNDATDKVTDNTDDKATEDTGNKIDVPAANVPDGSLLISGENRYRIIYPRGAKKSALPIYDKLVASDKLAEGVAGYYTLGADTLKDDGTPEILVGATNRELSTKAMSLLTSNKDYVILAEGNKIAICANTEAYLNKAVDDFISKLSVLDEYHVIYTNEKEYLVKYEAPSEISLDGKQVMFIGNSFIYYGNCVTYMLDDADRHVLDNGYFSQICQVNGEKVDVYNYTWMAKSLDWIYENKLTKEESSFLEQFDYVFISEAGGNNAQIVDIVEKITKLFPETTKFTYLIHNFHASNNHTNIFNACENEFIDMGIEVADWGGLVYDVWTGKTKVPGAKLEYNKETFVKNNTGVSHNPEDCNVGAGRPSDNYHENPLAGYITAQMAYCVVTNKSAVGQDYSFCGDTSVHKFFDFYEFIDAHYDANHDTNFPEVFASEDDMRGLQILIDEYIANHPAND